MKKTLIVLILLLLLVFAFGCTENNNLIIEYTGEEIRLSLEQKQEIGKELSKIALEKLKNKSDEINPIVSPITDYEILCETNEQQQKKFYSFIIGENNSQNTFFSSKYGFFIKDKYEISENIFSKKILYPKAEIYITESENSNISQINRYFKNNTNNVIKSVFDTNNKELSPNFTVASIMQFTGKWARQYDDKNVKDGIFTDIDGVEQKVKYLCSFENYYLECNGGYGVMKSYRDGEFVFIALLPPETMNVYSYIKTLDEDTFTTAIINPHNIAVNTKIPKFNATSYKEADKSVLEKLPKISSGLTAEYYMDAVCFSVDQNGTQGVSSTTINVIGANDEENSKTVVLDRPFFYAVVDRDSALPVLAGIIEHVE